MPETQFRCCTGGGRPRLSATTLEPSSPNACGDYEGVSGGAWSGGLGLVQDVTAGSYPVLTDRHTEWVANPTSPTPITEPIPSLTGLNPTNSLYWLGVRDTAMAASVLYRACDAVGSDVRTACPPEAQGAPGLRCPAATVSGRFRGGSEPVRR